MLLLLAAALSIAMGIFVAVAGQERRVKIWFLILCLGAAALAIGLYVEVRYAEWAFMAARVNMTAALALSSAGLLSARVMCGLPFHRPVIALLTVASVVNVATVWLTNAYFTGGMIEYPWGVYVAGDPKFVINPLLVSAIALYGLTNLAVNYKRAHALDKNRTWFLFASYLFLTFSLLDYLPHFNIDLFGGPISGLTIPLFLGTFGYAILRYRLLEFRSFVGKASGWVITTVLMVMAYALFLEAAERWLGLPSTQANAGAAISMFLVWLAVGNVLPQWAQRLLERAEPDFQRIVQGFSHDIMTVLDEANLHERMNALCVASFGSASATLVPAEALGRSAEIDAILMEQSWIETEVLHRQRQIQLHGAREAEILIPLRRQTDVLGALTLGKRSDGKMYTEAALQALGILGNIYSMALTNARSASEIEKRHQLDRYLAPQIVERVLSGNADLIQSKRRMMVTVFFSDLKGFTELADHFDPEKLSLVLNEYLSEMADIAFAHGGTVDKFIGDAVMVFFGAPVDSATTAQALQCVRMAVAMQRRIIELNTRWREAGILPGGLVSRMGIHTGEATVGSFGSYNRLDYTVIGRAVNLASRLEGQCKPGHILVSDATWEFVKSDFQGESRGAIPVKGFSEPVEVYQIDPANPRIGAGSV